jgi:hypothetical protein
VACVQVLETREVLSPPTVPGTPVLTGLGATSATISWGASTDDVAITGYSVYWIYTTGHSGRDGGITTHTILEASTDGSTTSVNITGLTQNKTYALYVKATDVAGYVSGLSRPVYVTPGAAPSGLSAVEVGSAQYSPISIVANHQLTVQLSASSFPAITYSIVSPPAGMTVDPVGGLVTWTPDASEVGSTYVTFQATNTFGTTAQTVPITVTADVPVPGFTFTNLDSPTFSVVGLPIGLQITDGSNTPSTYSVVSAPANVSIDPVTGQVNWIPAPDQAGAQALTFQLTNSAGTATITVNPVIYIADAPQDVTVTGLDTLTPTLSWSPPVYNSLVAGYNIMISGPDYLNYSFTTDGSTLSALLTGLAVYPGTYQVNIQATDANGNQGLWNTSLSFYFNPSVPNPTYAFTSNGGAAYAVVGQPATIQVTDLNTTSPDVFSLVSGPDGMTVDSNTGLVTWTPTLADLGASYPTIAVTNAEGTTYTTLSIPVVFASPVNDVTASFSAGGSGINVSWTAPTTAAEPIAGYDIYVSWTDGDGYVYNAGASFVPAGSNAFTLQNLPGDAASFLITVVAVDSTGNEGAYPTVGTTVTGGLGNDLVTSAPGPMATGFTPRPWGRGGR